MPDIIQDGSNEMMFWTDELCISCDVREGCPLLAAIRELELVAYSGCHVASCKRYEGDSDPYSYVFDDAVEDVVSVSEQHTNKLKRELGTVLSALHTLKDMPHG